MSLDSNVIVSSVATKAGSILEIGDSTATQLTAVNGTDLNSADTSSTATGNLGEIFVYTGSTLQIGYLANTFDNAGTLTLGKGAGGSGSGDLDLAGSVSLSGGGKLNLGQTGTFGDILNAPTTIGGLINVNNTISGSGLIELNSFDNQANGTIEAQSDLQIIAGTFTNEGGITAEASSKLDFGQDGAAHSIDNTGSVVVLANADLQISGTYTASGSGDIYLKGAGAEITSDGTAGTFINASTIEADNTSQIGDPNLTFSNSGTVAVSLSGDLLTINTGGHTVVNTGTLAAANGATLAIDSNLTNQGTLTAGAESSGETSTGTVDLGLDHGTESATNTGVIGVYGDSDLAIRGNYTVSGNGGDIGFKGAGADITSDGLAPATFTNASAIDAFYTGQIGDVGIESTNDLTFVNKGSVFATGAGVTLTINTGSLTINDAGGTLEAENGATLAIDSNVNTGVGGTIEAGSGSTVLISGALSGAGTLSAASGSVLKSTGGGSFAGAITGAGEVVIAGATTLNAGASLSVANLVETANLTLSGVSVTNAASHSFSITEGSGATVTLRSTGTGSFTNAGSLLIDGSGTALILGPLIDQGTISVTSGTLQVNGPLSGSGSLAIGAGAQALLTAGGTLTEKISGAGRLILGGGGTYKVNNANVTAGTVQVNSPSVLSGTGTLAHAVADNGTVTASAGKLLIDGAVSGIGTLSAGAAAVLDLAGGGSFAGAISGAGTVTLAGTTTLHAGATLSASDVIVTSELELAGVAVTNAAGHIFALTAASTASTATLYSGTGGAFTNAGSLIANGAGTASISGAFTNSGTVSALGGTLSFLSSVGGTGALDVGTAGTLSLGLGASSGQTVDFLGTTGVLDLSNPLDFVGKIAGFGGSDEIFLKNTAFTTFSFSNNLLTVKDGSTTVASLHITESSNHFSLTNTSHGVLITF